MTVSAETVLGAVEEIASLLEADGAHLRIIDVDDDGLSVELTVDFEDVSCEECVMPPARLRDTVATALVRRAGRPVRLVLHDPRAQVVAADGGLIAGQMVVLDPRGVAPDDGEADPGPDAGPLAGKTVAVRCDILWQSFDWTLDEWIAGLREAGAEVLTFRRIQGLVGADYERAQAEYEAVLSRADLAISGLANCGSCTSWTIRDALTAAERGLPTVAVA